MIKFAWFLKAWTLLAVMFLAGCVSYSREVREYDRIPPAVTYVEPAPQVSVSPPAYRYEYERKTERDTDRDADKSDTSSYYYREYRRESVR